MFCLGRRSTLFWCSYMFGCLLLANPHHESAVYVMPDITRDSVISYNLEP